MNWTKKIFLLFLFSTTSFCVSAQVNNVLLEMNNNTQDTMYNNIGINGGMQGVFKNNEYFSKIVQGYTLFANRLYTNVYYKPSQNVSIYAGAFLQKDFGNDTALYVKPMLTIRLSKNNYSFLFGTLDGNISHRMLDPLFDYERYINNPLEYGMQFKVDKKNFWSDTWLSWDKMQYLNSNYQEELTFGHHSIISIFNKEASKISIDIQSIFHHMGGQIDTINNPIKTRNNSSLGLVYEWNNKKEKSFLQNIKTENYFLLYKNFNATSKDFTAKGNAVYLNVSMKTRYGISASLSYWNAQRYLSSKSGALFMSESTPYGTAGYYENNRRLMFFRLLYQKKIWNQIGFDLRFEPYYDFSQSLFEYNYALYLNYKFDFGIFNFSKKN